MRHGAPILIAALALVACRGEAAPEVAATIPLTIEAAGAPAGGGTRHRFRVEVARTPAEQQKGLMYRPALAPDAGMLFAPYPPEGGAPRVASFWMKDTPSSLDIIFIRSDRTIATIAENTVPLSEAPVSSGEPVSAVLELRGGRAAQLGLQEGDRVSW